MGILLQCRFSAGMISEGSVVFGIETEDIAAADISAVE
jgi:hypothetical protein